MTHLRDLLRARLRSLPYIIPDHRMPPFQKKVDRYLIHGDVPLVHEHNLQVQHVWLRAHDIDPSRLGALEVRHYGEAQGCHSGVCATIGMRGTALVRITLHMSEQLTTLLGALARKTELA